MTFPRNAFPTRFNRFEAALYKRMNFAAFQMLKCCMARLRNNAFTSLELIVLIASFLLMILILPQMAKCDRCRGTRIVCISNQKQIALAFCLWANDNGDSFPMQVPQNKGGSEESVVAGSVAQTYLVLLNELNTPLILACPEDPSRNRVRDFAVLNQNAISYFLRLDARLTNGSGILLGDRNISLAGNSINGLMIVTNPSALSWTALMHKGNGNVALADGSGHQTTTVGLRQLVPSGKTNCFVIP